MPTFLVLAILAAAGWWGHANGWRIGPVAELLGGVATGEDEDWCEEHGIPESTCLACNPVLAGADPANWCREHGVPESECTICDPGPDPAAPAPPPDFLAGVDPAALARSRACRTHVSRVQLASAAAVAKAGIELVPVATRALTEVIAAPARVDYDRTRYARLAPKAAGTVQRVEKGPGEAVRAGEVLALVDSAAVGAAKAELLLAVAAADVGERALDRLRTARDRGFRTEAELQEAEAAARAARVRHFNARQALANLGLVVEGFDRAESSDPELAERLRFLGLPPEMVAALDPAVATANLLAVRAPFDGVVLERHVVAGEVVEIIDVLLSIADVGRMWILLDVALEDSGRLAVGQAVTFLPDVPGAPETAGTLAWTSTAVDEKTRTVRARAEVENADGRLRANVFGTGRIVLRQSPAALIVPEEAVQWEGCCHVVFVAAGDPLFAPRKVRLGVRQDGYAEILVGLRPGETIAAAGSHVLKSELLKGRLGAGCVDE
ncbi:MAG: efflux RND transporter periplasmic adaptor subunit [Planctomycetota bacterium]